MRDRVTEKISKQKLYEPRISSILASNAVEVPAAPASEKTRSPQEQSIKYVLFSVSYLPSNSEFGEFEKSPSPRRSSSKAWQKQWDGVLHYGDESGQNSKPWLRIRGSDCPSTKCIPKSRIWTPSTYPSFQKRYITDTRSVQAYRFLGKCSRFHYGTVYKFCSRKKL